jgi:hypothetical protein
MPAALSAHAIARNEGGHPVPANQFAHLDGGQRIAAGADERDDQVAPIGRLLFEGLLVTDREFADHIDKQAPARIGLMHRDRRREAPVRQSDHGRDESNLYRPAHVRPNA